MQDEELLEDVAGAILDGTPVDWSGIDSPAGEIDLELVAQLKTLATLTLAGRSTGQPHREPAAAEAPSFFRRSLRLTASSWSSPAAKGSYSSAKAST